MTDINFDGCVDCVMWFANGEGNHEWTEAEFEAYKSTVAERWNGYAVTIACSEDCEGHFSWSPCLGCGSTLGGDRHPMVAFAV